uniref:Calx-beta domain-containing protein n=1 Tax=Falsiroseomonas oryziterrae TaxID=2911368 RepID=UPI0035579B4F
QSAQGSTKPQLTIVFETGTTTPPASLALSGPLTQPEGNSGSTNFAFTVTRSGDTTQPASASWAVAGSGTNPASANDFAGATLPAGTVSFAPGETSQTIAVQVAGDTTVEPNETFTLTLSNPTGATIANASTTATITNDDVAAGPAFDESYIATSYSGRMRALEYGNASKSFFHDGHWFAVLPDGPKWAVERFDGPVPGAGQRGGWTKASTDNFLDNNRASDIAWDDATDSLYVLQYSSTSASPRMFKLSYDTATDRFVQTAEAQIAGPGGKLGSASWSKNAELVIGMDSFGTPLVANIGKTTSGADRGLNLAWGSKDLATWSEVRIDADPTGAGGNSKADIVSFTLNGTPMIGIAYSADTSGLQDNGAYGDWKFAWRPASANPADYAGGWTVETYNTPVGVDNHLSAAWDGRNIFIVMKDNHNDIWLTRGLPGSWETVRVLDSTGADREPSRPTIVVDQADDRLLIFYQRNLNAPYGDIYMKTQSLTGPLSFDEAELGTRAMRTTTGASLVDPQGPVHAVDASMDGAFHLFAADADLRQVWSNRVDLGVGELIG